MANKITVSEIARLAGVSRGTVDRVIHQRGKVSKDNLQKVENILLSSGYRFNLHTSAIPLRKSFKIAVCTPSIFPGGYWNNIKEGIEKAMDEYSDIDIQHQYFTFNQSDVKSCLQAFEKVLDYQPNSVIIGPAYEKETLDFCKRLGTSGIPYAFVDTGLKGASPVASFVTDQTDGGYLLGKLIGMVLRENEDMALLSFEDLENRQLLNAISRRKGFITYLKDSARKFLELEMSPVEADIDEGKLAEFLQENPSVKAIAVLNARSYLVAKSLKARGRGDIMIAGFDITQNNLDCLQDGSVSLLLCQRPQLQGFLAVKAMLSYLMYKTLSAERMMPIDVIFPQNLPYYSETVEI